MTNPDSTYEWRRKGEHVRAHVDPDTGQVSAGAFDRAPKDDDGLSVNRVGVFSGDLAADRSQLRAVMASRMKLGANAAFVQLNAGEAIATLSEFEGPIFICHDPLPASDTALENPAHALIIGLPFKGEAVGSLKSEEAGDRLRALIRDRFPARPPAAS